MAPSRRPTKPRRCAPKAAKPRQAPARPSTPKPRAQGKPRPVSSEPSAFERAVATGAPARLEIALRKLATADQVTQLACKRLRSVLGPLGRGTDDRSTAGHMLAMIEQLIEDRLYLAKIEQATHETIARMRSALGETTSQPEPIITADLTAITGRLIAALNARPANPATFPSNEALCRAHDRERPHVRASEPHSQIEPPRVFVAESTVMLRDALRGLKPNEAGAAIPDIKQLVGATLTVVRTDPPTADFSGEPDYGPRCEEKGQCEDYDGSGACYGCGRWLGDESSKGGESGGDPT